MSGTVKRQPLRADELMKLSDPERLEELVRVLNGLSDDTSGAVNRRLSILDNMRTQLFVAVPVRTPDAVENAFPLRLELGPHMPDKPTKIEITGIRNATAPSTPWTAAVQAFWENGDRRQIVITYISGLSANTQYVVDFLLWG